ncbi:MAG: A24 family peptidase [Oscillospiraceae bacterium]
MFNLVLIILLGTTASIDLKTKQIPTILQFLILATAPLNSFWSVQSAVLGALICGGILIMPSLFNIPSFGGGDIKLMAILGYVLGYRKSIIALFLAVSISLIPCIYYKITKKAKDIAFVPYILAGTVLAII